ncbi:MAG: hypothetical protein ACX94B_13040 [Henriciella sp.]
MMFSKPLEEMTDKQLADHAVILDAQIRADERFGRSATFQGIVTRRLREDIHIEIIDRINDQLSRAA